MKMGDLIRDLLKQLFGWTWNGQWPCMTPKGILGSLRSKKGKPKSRGCLQWPLRFPMPKSGTCSALRCRQGLIHQSSRGTKLLVHVTVTVTILRTFHRLLSSVSPVSCIRTHTTLSALVMENYRPLCPRSGLWEWPYDLKAAKHRVAIFKK